MAQCTALRLSDEQRCDEPATSLNGLFCGLHSRQCQGLYRGYKLRNARLDRLVASPPAYLAEHATPLANMTFGDVEETATLQEIHKYLFQRYALLDRVIRARKLHHSRFFSLNLDYGHQHFLDKLQSDRTTVVRALARSEKRAVQIQHQQSAWYGWVRDCQEEEEASREQEKKKVKQAADMFRRHRQLAERRTRAFLQKEHARQQDRYLDQAYNERHSEEESEAAWDPIEDVVEDEKGNHVDLIQQLLWLAEPETGDIDSSLLEQPKTPLATRDRIVTEGNSSSKASKARKKHKKPPDSPILDATVRMTETRESLRKRLLEGAPYHPSSHVRGVLVGTFENPEIREKLDPLSQEETSRLRSDVDRIKQLLFCRLLLSHASLLPAALRSESISAFLGSEEITETDLRDLALRLEQPSLKDIRDACADLVRNEHEVEVLPAESSGAEIVRTMKSKSRKPRYPELAQKRGLPDSWNTRREQQMTATAEGEGFVGFGPIDDKAQYETNKIKVKVCGHEIWNYPSGKAMPRGGWLQFCVLARDCSLFDAVRLCRHWDEFFELSTLAMYHYFPASNWGEWLGDRLQQQLLTLGFIPYFTNEHAEDLTVSHQSGSRGMARKSHAVFEARNFICAQVKRDDPASRRFIQYLALWSCHIVALVRDVKTGQIVIKPPEEERWLIREKSGYGRASRNEFNVIKRVGPDFTEEIDRFRRWHLGFPEVYDVIIWDREAGQSFDDLFNLLQKLLIRARRFKSLVDMHSLGAPTLDSIVLEPKSVRARDRQPDDSFPSLWYELKYNCVYKEIAYNKKTGEIRQDGEGGERVSSYEFFTETDEAEDDELFGDLKPTTDLAVPDPKQAMEGMEKGIDWDRFVLDLDPDEELPSEDDDSEEDGEEAIGEDDGDDDYEDIEDADAESDSTDIAQMLKDKNPDLGAVMDLYEGKPDEDFFDFFGSPAEVRRARKQLQQYARKPRTPYIQDPHTAFYEWIDREKAFKFKNLACCRFGRGC